MNERSFALYFSEPSYSGWRSWNHKNHFSYACLSSWPPSENIHWQCGMSTKFMLRMLCYVIIINADLPEVKTLHDHTKGKKKVKYKINNNRGMATIENLLRSLHRIINLRPCIFELFEYHFHWQKSLFKLANVKLSYSRNFHLSHHG